MNIIEFVFHGVPQGFDVWGSSGDKYYESFYNIRDAFKDAKSAFVVEIRKDDSNKWCAYYSYIRTNNVIAEGGRMGSYFGMSLKMGGEYCTDVYSLFQLMESIYEQKITGKIISKSGFNEKYNVASFSNSDSELKRIANLSIEQIKSNFENDFETIDASLTKKNASVSAYYNLNDINSESFFNATKECGKIFISPIYPSKDAIIASYTSSDKKLKASKIEYEEQITSLRKDNQQIAGLKGSVDSLSHQLESAKNEVKRLNADKERLQVSVNDLTQKLNSANHEIEKLKKSSNFEDIAQRLEPPVNEMLTYLKRLGMNERGKVDESETDSCQNDWKSMFKQFIPYVIAAIAIVIAIFSLKSRHGEVDSSISGLKDENQHLTERITELNDRNELLETDYVSVREEFDELIEYIRSESDVTIQCYTAEDKEIKESDVLYLGNTYKVKISEPKKKGTWEANGFDFGERENDEATITADKEGDVFLSYWNGDKLVIKNVYKVKKQ